MNQNLSILTQNIIVGTSTTILIGCLLSLFLAPILLVSLGVIICAAYFVLLSKAPISAQYKFYSWFRYGSFVISAIGILILVALGTVSFGIPIVYLVIGVPLIITVPLAARRAHKQLTIVIEEDAQ